MSPGITRFFRLRGVFRSVGISYFTFCSQEIRELNIISHYYYIIDREQRKNSPLKLFSLAKRIVYHFPPFQRALQNGYRQTGTCSEGLFPFALLSFIST